MFSPNFAREEFAKKLAQDLRIIRAAADVTQDEVAQALGVSRSTYVNYENRQKEIPWEKCLALLFYFERNKDAKKLIHALSLLPEEVQ